MSRISSAFPAANPYQATNLNAFTQFVNDFNAIGSALQSGHLSDAQSALAAFQQDLPGDSQSATHQPFGNDTQANADYQDLAGALHSGSLAGARQAYANLQNDLQETGKSQRRPLPQAAASTVTASSSSGDADSLLYARA
jgi:hypothetical protein